MKLKFITRCMSADTGLGSIVDVAASETNANSSENSTNENEVSNNDAGNGNKVFTQDEIDKIVSRRLERAQKKWEQETNKKIEEIKLSGMTPEQKQEYEKSKLDRELSEKERKLQAREMQLDAIDILQGKGLDRNLSKLLNYESEETVKESIATLETAIQSAVEKSVNDRLRGGNPPKAGNNKSSNPDAFLRGLMGSK